MLTCIAESVIGCPTHANDGQAGAVRDIFFSASNSWSLRFFVIDTGPWLHGRLTLVTPKAVESSDWCARPVAGGE